MSQHTPSPQRTVGNAATYSIANAIPRLLSFIFLPVYTRVLTPAEYGRLSLILVVAVGASFIFTSGLDIAILRIYYRMDAGDEKGRRRFTDSLWHTVALTSLAASVLALALASPFVGANGTVRFSELTLGVFGAAALVVSVTLPQSILRAQQRRRPYMLLSASNAALTTGATLLCVPILGLGPIGWLAAILGANILNLFVAITLVGWERPRPFDRKSVREAYGLGIPLIPHSLAQWSLLLADRIVVASLATAAALGIYSLAATMATPALVLVQSISLGFATAYARAGAEPDGERDMGRTISLHAVFVIWVCLAVALLGPCVVAVLADRSFQAAGELIPLLALGYLFLGLYYVPMNGLSLGLGRTRFVSLFSLASAALNLGLVWLLVPSVGLNGAAAASAVGYLALMVSVGIYAYRLGAPLEYEWAPLILALASAAMAGTLGTITASEASVGGIILRLGMTVFGVVISGWAIGLRPNAVRARLPGFS